MKWCIYDSSPSAGERGRTNEPVLCTPEEVHARVDKGTVWLYFFSDEDGAAPDFPNPKKHQFIAGVQFWQGWVNQLIDPKAGIGEAVRAAFGKYEDGLVPTREQIITALAEVEAALTGVA